MNSDNTSEELRTIFLNGLSPRCGAVLSVAFAEIISDGLTLKQINALGSFITAIGDNMAYIADQLELNGEEVFKSS